MQALILQLEASLRSGEDQVRQQSDLCLGLEKGKEDMLLASEDLKQRNASLRSNWTRPRRSETLANIFVNYLLISYRLAQAIHQHEVRITSFAPTSSNVRYVMIEFAGPLGRTGHAARSREDRARRHSGKNFARLL